MKGFWQRLDVITQRVDTIRKAIDVGGKALALFAGGFLTGTGLSVTVVVVYVLPQVGVKDPVPVELPTGEPPQPELPVAEEPKIAQTEPGVGGEDVIVRDRDDYPVSMWLDPNGRMAKMLKEAERLAKEHGTDDPRPCTYPWDEGCIGGSDTTFSISTLYLSPWWITPIPENWYSNAEQDEIHRLKPVVSTLRGPNVGRFGTVQPFRDVGVGDASSYSLDTYGTAPLSDFIGFRMQ